LDYEITAAHILQKLDQFGRRWTPALRQRLLAQSANIWCRFFRKNAEVVLTPTLLFDRKALT